MHLRKRLAAKAGMRSMLPIVVNRTLFLIRSGVCFSMLTTIRFIKASTSSCGRFQFSVENVYSVRNFTPTSLAISVTCLTVETPFS